MPSHLHQQCSHLLYGSLWKIRKLNSANNALGCIHNFLVHYECGTYRAAPTTESATDRPIPTVAHMYGLVCSKNLKSSNQCNRRQLISKSWNYCFKHHIYSTALFKNAAENCCSYQELMFFYNSVCSQCFHWWFCPECLQLFKFTPVFTFCIMDHTAVQNSDAVEYLGRVNLVYKMLLLLVCV